jgi:hypothetical protein
LHLLARTGDGDLVWSIAENSINRQSSKKLPRETINFVR